ncbi:MAG: MFS transporter [Fidelibacterota bacterium]
MIRSFRLLKNQAFTFFFIGNAISLIGWGFNFIAVGWIILDRTGSVLALAKINIVATLPGLAIAIYAGSIIDRMNRKHLLVFLDIFRLVSVIAVPILMWLGYFAIWHLYAMAFLIGLGSSMFWPTAAAYTQEIVHSKDYLAANSLLSASYQTGSLLGSALGGFVIHWFGVEIALLTDAVTYFLSALLIGISRHQSTVTIQQQEGTWETFRKGFIFIRQEKVLFAYGVLIVFADVAIWGNFGILTITYSKDVLLAGARGFGLLDGFYGIGALLSTFFALQLAERWARKYLLLVYYFLAGLMCLLLPLYPVLGIGMGLYLVMGLANNSARIQSRTILMEQVPNAVMGRFQMINGVITRILIIFSAMFCGWVVDVLGVIAGIRLTAIWFWISMIGILWIARFRPEIFLHQRER